MAQEATLLFVDDELGVLKALRRVFFEEGYRLLTAGSGAEALEIMAKETVDLIISDQRMPGMTGVELLREMKQRWPETIRIMLTGHGDVQTITEAVNDGAVYKFITKPWHDEDLKITVRLALEQRLLAQENKKLKEIARKQEAKLKTYAAILDENRSILGNILVKAGVITPEQLKRALREQAEGELLGNTILRLRLTEEQRMIETLRQHLQLQFIDLAATPPDPAAVKLLPRELCEKSRLIPVRLRGKQLQLAKIGRAHV